MTNLMLRDHVTGAAFHLILGKTHIAALVHLEHAIDAGMDWESSRSHRPPGLGNFVGGASGLVARGLVAHVMPPDGTDYVRASVADFWQITPAGRLVLDLLREAGVWHEYSAVPDAKEGAE